MKERVNVKNIYQKVNKFMTLNQECLKASTAQKPGIERSESTTILHYILNTIKSGIYQETVFQHGSQRPVMLCGGGNQFF